MKFARLLAGAGIALVLLSAVAGDADAQGFPGGRGQGRGGNRGGTEAGDPAAAGRRTAAPAVMAEPAIALERELPSLRVDLLLDGTQVPAWTAFERSVRDAAQAAHARQRRTVEERQVAGAGGIDLPAGAAVTALQGLIDDGRSRADLLAGIIDALGALTRLLDPRQAGMINRRVVQALRDPLGAS